MRIKHILKDNKLIHEVMEKGDENNLVKKDKAAMESYETKIQKVRNAFEGNMNEVSNGEGSNMWVVYTFESSVILKEGNTEKYYEAEYSILEDGSIVKGNPKEVELTYVQKRLITDSIDFSSIKSIDDLKNALDIVKKYDWSWAGSFTQCVEVLTDKPGIDNPEGLCSWLHHEAEGKWPGEKAREERVSKSSCELTGPIVKKNNLQRIVYAAVLVPGEPDYDYDKGEKILTVEEIERVAHKWMLDYMNIDIMHSLNNVAKPVETFLLPMEWNVEAYGQKLKLPLGTWVMASKVTDDDAWKKVESGELTGYSVMGIRNTALKSLLDSASKGKDILEEIKAVLKKTLLKDLGDDWIVPFVSLVNEACIPKSKFFAIKSREKGETEGIISRLVNFVKGQQKDESEKGILEVANSLKDMVEKKGRAISDATYTQLKNAIVALNKLVEKADKEREQEESKNKKQKGDDDKMDEKEVQKLIEEQLKPLIEAWKVLIPEKKEEGKKEPADKDGKVEPVIKTDVKVDDKESLTKTIGELQETIKKYKEEKDGKSNSLKGQDDVKDDKPYTHKNQMDDLGRDGFGRKKKPEKK